MKQFKIEEVEVTRDMVENAKFVTLDDLTREALKKSGNPKLAAMADDDPEKARKAMREYAIQHFLAV